MARMPGAKWRPIPVNYTPGGQRSVRGVVVHIMDGSYEGTDSWFRNSKARASSHFGTSRDGELCQWVDTADRAWAQAGGNSDWLSVENEGRGGDELTTAQLDANARVLAWAHQKYDVPLKIADGPDDEGLGYHAMGGAAWGGHTSCPGSKVVKQLPEIVNRAKKIAGTGGTGSSGGTAPAGVARYTVTINGLTYGYGAHGDHITRVGKALVAAGFGRHYKVGPGPEWTDADTRNYADYQKSLGYRGADADGVPGPDSLRRLLGTLPGKATPTVDLSKLVTAAKSDPPKKGTPVSYAGARIVEAALAAENLLDEQYVDGHFGTATKTAYAAWQRRCGYSGRDADGIPGRSSLAALGRRHGFRVVA
ncbi:peptidoglycan-binding protein [Streptomyces sp. LB8]|uniref:peptidoglycan-binding protein n=1 Tax=Streptomyces sp. LB8 TaxID=3042509 RepID=UPI002648C2E2|nr:peptidoglycan-binding protein [Streptomyces sp. LB8]MDN5380738.1 peptidoglycan-binding protein [Streptomyces sp. LB8]